MKPIAGLSHAELAGAMRGLDGVGERRRDGTWEQIVACSQREGFRIVSVEESGGWRLESGERAREERRAWKR
jgi:hypothetical protein